jgi:hypothetical protein
MPLKDIVLQIIDRIGGKRESVYGLKVANQCFRYELLELIRSDGTKVQFSKTDCEHPTVCAAPVNPAEAIWVEPREDGRHFVRRPATPPALPAEPPQSPATATPPADRQLPAAGETEPAARVEASMLEPVPPAESMPAPPTESSRASRQRRNQGNQGSGPQTRRARVVLKRIYGGPDKYPTREKVPDADLYDCFAEEYEKVEGKAEPKSRWGMPSLEVVLREVGRKD